MLSIGIVGAGLIGRLITIQLIKQGYHVTLFDKDSKAATQSAAYAAAGLLTPLGESLHSPKSIVDMGVKSMQLWPEILASLTKKVFFQQTGSLLVSHAQDEGDYQHFRRFVIQNFTEHETQTLSRNSLTALEPELGRSFQQGLYIPEEGQIDNRALLEALTYELTMFEENGLLDWQSEKNVHAICPSESKAHSTSYVTFNPINATLDATEQVSKRHFDLTIDCRGLGAQSNKPSSSLPALRGVRGELFRLFAPDVKLSRPVRLMHPRYQLYIAPKENNMYVVGATQIESDDMSPMTVRSAMELLSAAYSVHSGFGEAKIVEHTSQLRPAFNDNQPHIFANLHTIHVNGLYRHGYLISPVVASQVVDLVNNINHHKQMTTSEKTNHADTFITCDNAEQLTSCIYSHLLPITWATPYKDKEINQ